MNTFTLPDLGEGLQDAEIVAWHVAVGDRVVADQPLVSVETDKAVVEVPAPRSGSVTALHAAAGDIVKIGAPLADIDGEGAADAPAGTDPGAVVGELPESGKERPPPVAAVPARLTPSRGVRAVPAVRKLAAELGVALDDLAGSGPGGAITRADVEAAVGPPEGWEPLRGIRRAMARNMARANAEVAVTTVTDAADVTQWAEDADVTMRLIGALVVACRAAPALNAWYDGRREARRLHEHIDLGIAVDTGEGLFAPVLRDVGGRAAADLRSGLDAMKRDLAARTVPRDHLKDPTISLSNFGTIGGRYAALAVVPPQVAILGAGRITQAPRVVEGAVVAGRMLPLSLSFDHRAVTGAEASRFLMAAVEALESHHD